VELIGEEIECNSCYVYYKAKGWFQKSSKKIQNNGKGLNNEMIERERK
jgi:hypothetical protein